MSQNVPPFNLRQYEITVDDIRRNYGPARLYPEALRDDAGSALAESAR